MHPSATAPVPASDPSRAGNAVFYTVQGLPWRSDKEQSRVMAQGPPAQALHRMGKFSCCYMQEDLILKDEMGEGLHGKQEYLAIFQETGKSDI